MTENIWRGDKVRLRAWEPADWVHQARWSQDTGADRRTYYIPFPISEAMTKQQAQDYALKRPENDTFNLIVEALGGQAVGVIGAHDTDTKNGTFTLAIYVEEEHRRKGFAREAIVILLRYLFLERRYQKGGAAAYGFNEASQKLLESVGMQVEGRQRRMQFTDGVYHDMVHYGITIEEFCEKHADWLARHALADG